MKRSRNDMGENKRRKSDRLQGYLGHTDVGGVGTGTKGSYNAGMHNERICKLLGAGHYVLVTTDVMYMNKSIAHSVLLVKGSTIKESSKFPDDEKSLVYDNDLVMIDSNAGAFLLKAALDLGFRTDDILETITNETFRTTYGHHDNWVNMMNSIKDRCGFSGVKTFGKDFMKKEYCELYAYIDSQCQGQDGICGEFAQTVAKWFRNESYLNLFTKKCKECADGTYAVDCEEVDTSEDVFDQNSWSASDSEAGPWLPYDDNSFGSFRSLGDSFSSFGSLGDV